MDTIRKELVDDQRALQIFPNIRARLSAEKIKTDEKYIALLIEEINSYFADLSTSVINTSDLPNDHYGPESASHNKLLVNVISDIDKLHNKRTQVQEVITKAFNYLSSDRVTIDNAVSKMYSRIVNQQLRASSNDRHLTVFTEYFTDNTFVDASLSTNVEVDPGLSALTLTAVTSNIDNSNLIDPASIYIQVGLKNSVQDYVGAIYPIGTSTGADVSTDAAGSLFAGFGRILDTKGIVVSDVNLNSANYKDRSIFLNIQSQCLIDNTNTSSEGPATFGEFELVFNDFLSNNVDTSIINAVKTSKLNTLGFTLDDKHIIRDSLTGLSFNGSKLITGNVTDNNGLISQISSMGLLFSIKPGSSLGGLVSYIDIEFAPAANSLVVPNINYGTSYIKDVHGKRWIPFKSMAPNTAVNTSTVSKRLLLDILINDPVTFYIDFDLTNLNPTAIAAYTGLCWSVKLDAGALQGSTYTFVNPDNTISAPVNLAETNLEKLVFVYHDPVRYSTNPTSNDLNLQTVKSIISLYETTSDFSAAPAIPSA